ncbi:MAG: hypothetical protein PWQ29_1124 [Verrucomicrobiota bacterium]|jgi:glycosyltransferase involved in cell wall biosynthesis|nr:hypothetical protein [Verrucomicrobiota bacterium]
MRIGISLLNFRPGKVGGIETYINKVIELAPVLAENDEVVFFVHRGNRLSVPDSANTAVINCSQSTVDLCRILEAFTPWRSRSVTSLIKASGVDVMLYTQQSMFPLACPVPSVLIVADVQYLFSPQYYSWFDLQFRKRVYLRSLHGCSAIAPISEFTARHLIESCGVSAEKIRVIPHGYDPSDSGPVPSGPIPDFPYLYYPAASYPHKGHAALFRSFAKLKRAGSLKQKLILSGIQTGHWKVLERIIRSENMQEEIIHLGYVSYSQVMALYAGADAILFPSEFEGFGLPVLEAVPFRKKIICSSLPVFDELGVPREWQIDYLDPDQLRAALLQSGPTELLRKPISWQEAIRQTITLLREEALSCD